MRYCKLDNGTPVAIVPDPGADTLPIEVENFAYDPETQIRIGPRPGHLGRIYSGGQRFYEVHHDKVIERYTVLNRRTDYISEDGTPTEYNARIHDIVAEEDEQTDTEYIRTITVRVNEAKLARAPLEIDAETGDRIAQRVHPESGTHLEVGILRQAVTELYNQLGLEAPAELQRHVEIAIEEIAEGRERKEELDGNRHTA